MKDSQVFICISFAYICMGCFGSSSFSQRIQRITDWQAPGGTEAPVRFPKALGGSQDPNVREGVKRGQNTRLHGWVGTVGTVRGHVGCSWSWRSGSWAPLCSHPPAELSPQKHLCASPKGSLSHPPRGRRQRLSSLQIAELSGLGIPLQLQSL